MQNMTQCPRCRTPLRLVVESNAEIDVCDDCCGIWLDPGELDQIATSTRETLSTIDSVSIDDLQCPRCRTRDFSSIRTNLGGFALCSTCDGMFVGGDTMDAIAKSDRRTLPETKTAEMAVGSLDIFGAILDTLWLFGHH